MILEGVVTTTNEDDSVNVSPMGPLVESESFDSFVLRPFQTSTTYRNLKRNRRGVLHVTDDVELIARAAINQWTVPPDVIKPQDFDGYILQNACRWLTFQVDQLDDSDVRTTIQCSIVARGHIRDFFGFCRAKHAVLEAAILATRFGILPLAEIEEGLQHLEVLVAKTGGDAERRAFDMLTAYVLEKIG